MSECRQMFGDRALKALILGAPLVGRAIRFTALLCRMWRAARYEPPSQSWGEAMNNLYAEGINNLCAKTPTDDE